MSSADIGMDGGGCVCAFLHLKEAKACHNELEASSPSLSEPEAVRSGLPFECSLSIYLSSCLLTV